MTDMYLRLDGRPKLSYPAPTCGACDVEVAWLDHGYICRSCGTHWGSDVDDGDLGDLYPHWSGQAMTGPVCLVAVAWKVSHLSGEDRDRAVADACPDARSGAAS